MSDSIKKWHEMQEEKALRIKDAVVTIDTPKYIYESPDGEIVTRRPFNGDIEDREVISDPKKSDRYVQQIKEKFEQRSQTGINKYNTTLERDDLSIVDWLNHAQEEAMDLALYLEVLKDKLK